jgi:hypothetical protein
MPTSPDQRNGTPANPAAAGRVRLSVQWGQDWTLRDKIRVPILDDEPGKGDRFHPPAAG